MQLIDFVVVGSYFILLQLVGFWAGRNQKNSADFFSGAHTLPWWVIAASIVAAETSSLTFISVPGIAYTGNFTFMQLAFGYVIGRVVVAFVFLPAYFKGNIETVYAFLEKRFSTRVRRLAALLFQVTRLLGTGVRLYATALPLSLISGWSISTSIIIFTLLTLPYTFFGGLKAAVWVEFIQTGVYLLGAFAAIAVLSLSGVNLFDAPSQKFTFLNMGFDKGWVGFFTEPFHFIVGILGGALLTISSHGTDQLIVQKALAAKNIKDAQKAMVSSGVLVDLQFLLFLFIGIWLFVFFQNRSFATSDMVFPTFIVESMPKGLLGLVLAAIFATGQSTLSATLSSLSSSTLLDLFPRYAVGNEKKRLWASRLLVLFWACAITLVAFIFTDEKNPVVIIALKLASILAGGTVALYVLGFFRFGETSALVGFTASALSMAMVALFSPLAWTWYVPLGLFIAIFFALIYRFTRPFFVRGFSPE
ncbi:MAG: Sodium/glucose cotransporter [Turneriella sp.]|nr:Sodium/glucose cotransporter [Turneriella sp.]